MSVSSIRSYRSHRTIQFQLLQHYWLEFELDYRDTEWFYEDLQDPLELTPQNDVLFIIGDWNAKVGSQEIPGVTGVWPWSTK